MGECLQRSIGGWTPACPLSRLRERVGVRAAAPHVSYTDNDEHAPHFPHPALMSAERMLAWPSIAPSGSSTEVMNSGDGAAWSSSGVPLIGTKGTTKGYTPSPTSYSQIDRIASRVSPSPARM